MRSRLAAAIASLVVGITLLVIKFIAYKLTGSQAIFSDAAESIVNVVAASAALFVIVLSRRPADTLHPYGFGKAEFFSATFEGGLLAFAAIMIIYEAIMAWMGAREVTRLDTGLILVISAGVINALLGLYLKHVGKKQHSLALEASGHHVMSDFWTSVAVVSGLVMVKLTGLVWMDVAVALGVGLHLGFTGWKLVMRSAGALMDKRDVEQIHRFGELFTQHAFPGIIRIHHTRAMSSESYLHVDAHVVLPEYWTVEKSHDETGRFEDNVFKDYGSPGEIHFHMDPCRRAYCRVCDVADCPVRVEPFKKRIPFTYEELTSPVELPIEA